MKKILLLTLLSFICCNNSKKEIAVKDYSVSHNEALRFCKDNDFNTDYYFLLDLSIHPGKNRFFIYDFNQKKITDKKLVTHGSCDVLTENKDKWEKQNSIILPTVIAQ